MLTKAFVGLLAGAAVATSLLPVAWSPGTEAPTPAAAMAESISPPLAPKGDRLPIAALACIGGCATPSVHWITIEERPGNAMSVLTRIPDVPEGGRLDGVPIADRL